MKMSGKRDLISCWLQIERATASGAREITHFCYHSGARRRRTDRGGGARLPNDRIA
jgi:hypothetical protein